MYDRELKGLNAIVTGGSRGIGKAVVEALLAKGVRVLATARDPLRLAQLDTDLSNPGLVVYPCDLADPSDIDELFRRARLVFPKLDLLVNNAGVGIYGPATELSVADWDTMMATNARGAFLCAQQAFRWMTGTGGGRLIHIASVVAHKGYENQVGYVASKHALLGLAKTLAREGQKHNIRSCVISPGGVATEMAGQARPDLDPAGLIQPADVARAVLYLATEPDSVVTDEIQLRRAGSTPFA